MLLGLPRFKVLILLYDLFQVTWYDVANATAVLLCYVIKINHRTEKALQKTH